MIKKPNGDLPGEESAPAVMLDAKDLITMENQPEDLDPLEEVKTTVATSSMLQQSAAPPAPHLVVVSGPDRGRDFTLGPVETTIGRGKDCQVVVSDLSVSRRHVTITPDGGGYVVRDLGSGNGTLINGQRMPEAVLRSGDQVEIGSTMLRFEFPGHAAAGAAAYPAPPPSYAPAQPFLAPGHTQKSGLRPTVLAGGAAIVLVLIIGGALLVRAGDSRQPQAPTLTVQTIPAAGSPAVTPGGAIGPPPAERTPPPEPDPEPEPEEARTVEPAERSRNTARRVPARRPREPRDARAAEVTAAGLYRRRKFDDAIDRLRQAANSNRGPSKSRLNSIADRYTAVRIKLRKGEDQQGNDPAKALRAFKSALSADRRAGKIHAAYIQKKIAATAPRAAVFHANARRYAQARVAADDAERYGSGGDPYIAKVRTRLSNAARTTFIDGQKAARNNPAKAHLLWKKVLKMVARDNQWYKKAANALHR